MKNPFKSWDNETYTRDTPPEFDQSKVAKENLDTPIFNQLLFEEVEDYGDEKTLMKHVESLFVSAALAKRKLKIKAKGNKFKLEWSMFTKDELEALR